MSRIIHSTLPEMKSRSTDDPQVVAAQRANDYSNHMVPITARIGRWQLTMSYWSLLSAMIWIFYGALVAGLYGCFNAVIAIVLSVVTYSIMGGIFTRWGIRSGLNSAMLTRRMFGTVGALLTAFLVSANTVYYAVFESSTLAVAFQYYTPDWDIRIWYAIVVVAMLPLMLGGVQTWMGRMNGILLPFYGLGLILVLVLTAVNYDSQGWMDFAGIVPEEARAYPGWLLGFVLYMGFGCCCRLPKISLVSAKSKMRNSIPSFPSDRFLLFPLPSERGGRNLPGPHRRSEGGNGGSRRGDCDPGSFGAIR